MTYSVKEIFYTLQGEGKQAGRPAVFCRFSGCNLWSGRESDRQQAICQFCDTEFVGTDGINGGKFKDAESLAKAIDALWPTNENKFTVLTGGEPGLQVDSKLVTALHECGFFIAIESNGTVPLPDGLDWICISPKAGTDLVVKSCDELKIVYPQTGLDPSDYASMSARYRLLSPMDNTFTDNTITDNSFTGNSFSKCNAAEMNRQSTVAVIEYVKQHPMWHLSMQSHKYLDIP